MKKIISVLVAVIMAVSAFAATMIPAMAAETVKSPSATIQTDKKPDFEVNGSTSNDVKYTTDEDSSTIHVEYTGEGSVTEWENNLEDLGLIEGVDFIITKNADGSIDIKLLTNKAINVWNSGSVIINAKVPGAGGSSAKPDSSNKSPNTGVSTSVIAGGVAVAGAGIAVISAMKKRDAE